MYIFELNKITHRTIPVTHPIGNEATENVVTDIQKPEHVLIKINLSRTRKL